MIEPTYTFDLEEWDSANIENLKMAFSQIEEHFKFCIQTSEKTTNRLFGILAISLSVIAYFLQGFIETVGKESGVSSLFQISTWIVIGISLIATIIILFQIAPGNMMYPGRTLREFSDQSIFYSKEYNGDEQVRAYLIGEIENTQWKIDYMDRLNQKRMRILAGMYLLLSIGLTLTLAVVGWNQFTS